MLLFVCLSSPHLRGSGDGEMKDPGYEVGKLSRSALFTGVLSVHPTKGTVHNKFVRRGPTLSGVEGLLETPPISRTLPTKFFWL